ncbi:MAG: LysR family transcriptional regulator [Deltaproteobacteria bacterium]|nr:LysR family transcriptional regulator [Deltaproteobacteria bacterium]
MRINLWLEAEGGILLGRGRHTLLEKIDALGSLKQAAQELGMSYRAAWGKLKQTEEALGAPLIEKHGSNRSGYRLTPLGREMLRHYREWLNEVEDFALDRARPRFGAHIAPYERKVR